MGRHFNVTQRKPLEILQNEEPGRGQPHLMKRKTQNDEYCPSYVGMLRESCITRRPAIQMIFSALLLRSEQSERAAT